MSLHISFPILLVLSYLTSHVLCTGEGEASPLVQPRLADKLEFVHQAQNPSDTLQVKPAKKFDYSYISNAPEELNVAQAMELIQELSDTSASPISTQEQVPPIPFSNIAPSNADKPEEEAMIFNVMDVPTMDQESNDRNIPSESQAPEMTVVKLHFRRQLFPSTTFESIFPVQSQPIRIPQQFHWEQLSPILSTTTGPWYNVDSEGMAPKRHHHKTSALWRHQHIILSSAIVCLFVLILVAILIHFGIFSRNTNYTEFHGPELNAVVVAPVKQIPTA